MPVGASTLPLTPNPARLLGLPQKVGNLSVRPAAFSTTNPMGLPLKTSSLDALEDDPVGNDARKRKRDETPLETPQEALLRKKLKAAVLADFGLTLLPDFMTPFEDLDDAVNRLLGYHLYQEYDAYEGSYAVLVSSEKAEFPELSKPTADPAAPTSASTSTPTIAGATATTSAATTTTTTTTAPGAAAVPAPAAIVPGMTANSTQTLNSITTTNLMPTTPAGKATLERGWRTEYFKPPGKLRRHRDPDFPDDADLMDVDSDEEGTFEDKIEASARALLDRAEAAMSQIPVRTQVFFETTPFGLIPREDSFLMQRLLYAEEHSELNEEKQQFEKAKKDEETKKTSGFLPAPAVRRQPPGIAAVQVRLAEIVAAEMKLKRNNPNHMKVLNSLNVLANKVDLPQEQLNLVRQVVQLPHILEALFQQSAGGIKPPPAPAKAPGR